MDEHDRDLLDRGDGITVLLCDADRGTVLLLKQARIAAFMRLDGASTMIEACNGQVEAGETPLACAIREVEQETGCRVETLECVGKVFASPGASLELIHLYLGRYDHSLELGSGRGLVHEGEDIETFEVPFAEALDWANQGVITDARTVLAIQFAAQKRLFEPPGR